MDESKRQQILERKRDYARDRRMTAYNSLQTTPILNSEAAGGSILSLASIQFLYRQPVLLILML